MGLKLIEFTISIFWASSSQRVLCCEAGPSLHVPCMQPGRPLPAQFYCPYLCSSSLCSPVVFVPQDELLGLGTEQSTGLRWTATLLPHTLFKLLFYSATFSSAVCHDQESILTVLHYVPFGSMLLPQWKGRFEECILSFMQMPSADVLLESLQCPAFAISCLLPAACSARTFILFKLLVS